MFYSVELDDFSGTVCNQVTKTPNQHYFSLTKNNAHVFKFYFQGRVSTPERHTIEFDAAHKRTRHLREPENLHGGQRRHLLLYRSTSGHHSRSADQMEPERERSMY